MVGICLLVMKHECHKMEKIKTGELLRIKRKLNRFKKMIENLEGMMQDLLTQEFLSVRQIREISRRFNNHIYKIKREMKFYYDKHKEKFDR